MFHQILHVELIIFTSVSPEQESAAQLQKSFTQGGFDWGSFEPACLPSASNRWLSRNIPTWPPPSHHIRLRVISDQNLSNRTLSERFCRTQGLKLQRTDGFLLHLHHCYKNTSSCWTGHKEAIEGPNAKWLWFSVVQGWKPISAPGGSGVIAGMGIWITNVSVLQNESEAHSFMVYRLLQFESKIT